MGRPRRRQLRWYLVWLPVWLIVLVGVVASVRSADARRAEVVDEGRSAFQAQSLSHASGLATALRRNADLATAASGFLSATSDPEAVVTNSDMARWFGAIGPERYLGLNAIGFIERIPAAGLADFERRANSDPVPLTAEGPFELVPAGPREEYCLIRAGVAGLQTTLSGVPKGLDVCAIPELGAALVESMISGELVQVPQFSGPDDVADAGQTAASVGLSAADQERLRNMQVQGSSVVILAPVYRDGGAPQTAEERRRAHVGWAIVAYDARATLVANLVASEAEYASVASRNALSASGTPTEPSAILGERPSGEVFTEVIDFDADGSWRAVFEVSSAGVLRSAQDRWLASMVQTSAVTLLVVLLLLVVVTSRQRALRLVDERTGELRRQALHDTLTGLPNRALILDRTERMLTSSRRDGRVPAILFVDLDGFKAANDTLGHAAGDRLLRAAASRLTSVVREGDTVGRMGGDEFVVLTSVDPLGAGPQVVADRLLDVLREPFHLEPASAGPISITGSVGIALGDRATPDELLHDADVALYQAKEAGKDRWALFEPLMHESARRRLETELDLRAAVEGREFRLEFLPTFDLREVSVTGVEALLRWDHPGRGVVQPLEFLPLAEETGLIVPIGRWVMGEACRRGAEWHADGHRIRVAVNVSPRQLRREDFVDLVRSTLQETGFDPGYLVLEVSESTLMDDADATAERLHRLKKLGVLIAVDDFGTGYSSLSYLKQFPVDSLKIDRSFIAGIADSRESTALIHTLVQLGRDLGIETLAEGIEEQGQLGRLRGEQCDSGQGFLFGRPLKGPAVAAFLESWSNLAHQPPGPDGVSQGATGKPDLAVRA